MKNLREKYKTIETFVGAGWLAIFRDDYGFINYQPHNTNRSVNYIPFDLSKNDLYEMICKYSNPHPAINDFK